MPTAAAILARAKARALLITDLTNIRYLTGLSLSAGYVLIAGRKIVLFADSRYLQNAKKTARPGITVQPIENLTEDMNKLRSCALEAEQITIGRFTRLQKRFPKTRFRHCSDVIEFFRRTKTPDEIRSILKACAITKKILLRLPSLLKPGVTEREVSWQIRRMAHEMGVDEMAFDTIVGFGEHSAHPHHHVTDAKFRSGDLVQIDMGVKVNGYCSDYSRVYFTGKPDAEQRKAYKALQKAKKSAESAVRPGITGRELDKIARKVLKTYGYGKEFSHALGHGVGLDIHEGVTLSSKAKPEKILKHEVITIEPGLYFPGKWGMRIEDTVVVNE